MLMVVLRYSEERNPGMCPKARMCFVLASLLLLVATVATAQPKWTMKTKLVIVDSCPIACPCLFGEEGHHGHCRFVGAAHVVEGDYEGTSLAGVKWGMLGEFTGKAREPEYRYSAFYIDSAASAKQKEAMRAILSGAPFSTLGDQLGIKEAAISLTKTEGDRYTLKIGDLGEFSVVPVYGNNPDTPLKISNPVYPFPTDEVTIGAATGSFSDHGKDLDLESNSGEISTFTLTGE